MRGTLLLLAMVVPPSAALSADEPAEKDLMLLQGRWDSVLVVHSGKEVKPENVKSVVRFVIKGDKVFYLDKDGNVPKVKPTAHQIKLDSTTKPKQMDYIQTEDNKDKISKGIFDVKGDDLKICLDVEDKGRPKAFESKEGSGHRLLVLKRVKS